MFCQECPICYENVYINIVPYLVCCKNGKLCCEKCVKTCIYCFSNLSISQKYHDKINY